MLGGKGGHPSGSWVNKGSGRSIGCAVTVGSMTPAGPTYPVWYTKKRTELPELVTSCWAPVLCARDAAEVSTASYGYYVPVAVGEAAAPIGVSMRRHILSRANVVALEKQLEISQSPFALRFYSHSA
jgi:hypothetical protein